VGLSALGLLGLVITGGAAGLLAGALAGEQRVAQHLADAVAGVPGLLGVVREATGLGSPVAAAVVLVLTGSSLLLDRRSRLAGFVAVTGAGAAVLGAGTTAAVALAPPGPTGPDEHTLSAVVTYGVLVVVVSPTVAARWRRTAVVAAAVLVVVVGLTRLALGDRPSSVVLGGLLGAGWLTVTTRAFGYRRPPAHRPAPDAAAPVSRPARRAAALAGTWVLLLVVLLAAGALVTGRPAVQGVDRWVTTWLVAIRTPELTPVAQVCSALGDTPTVVAGALALVVLAAAASHSARPVLLVVLVLGGELALFLVTGAVVERPRPGVGHLGLLVPPTSSFPSGHVSAAVCLYGLAALLATPRLAAPWRRLPLVVAATLVLAVGWGRLYYGVHHPSDVLASLLFAVPWLLACWRLGPPVVVGRVR
jgi:undecaprenyl-diphosphatase